MAIEGTTDYVPTSGDKLNNKKIVQFNFGGLVAEYDKARAASTRPFSLSMSSYMLNFYLNSSDTSAIGGDLAYQYAHTGNLAGISLTPAQGLLASTQFGTANQNLQATSSLQDLSPRLM